MRWLVYQLQKSSCINSLKSTKLFSTIVKMRAMTYGGVPLLIYTLAARRFWLATEVHRIFHDRKPMPEIVEQNSLTSLPLEILLKILEYDDRLLYDLSCCCAALRRLCDDHATHLIRTRYGPQGLELAAMAQQVLGMSHVLSLLYLENEFFLFSPETCDEIICRRDANHREILLNEHDRQTRSAAWNSVRGMEWGWSLVAANVHEFMLRLPTVLPCGYRYKLMVDLTCRNIASLADILVRVTSADENDSTTCVKQLSSWHCPRVIQHQSSTADTFMETGRIGLCIAQFDITGTSYASEWKSVIIELSELSQRTTRNLTFNYMWTESVPLIPSISDLNHSGWFALHQSPQLSWKQARNLERFKQYVRKPCLNYPEDMKSRFIFGHTGMGELLGLPAPETATVTLTIND